MVADGSEIVLLAQAPLRLCEFMPAFDKRAAALGKRRERRDLELVNSAIIFHETRLAGAYLTGPGVVGQQSV